ncbi:MAG: rRNA pseudouridine synthase [Deltaproteobacteria bacterium]|nr:MAG: rRNA pseudouridine synthase [Deltaproteobacteria bacterium]
MPRQRLQKILAASGLASRRQAEYLIAAGRVSVNGRQAGLGDQADPEVDHIEVDGRVLPPPEPTVCLLLNKPAGCITTRRDPQGRPTVFDLVSGVPWRLFAVGRLDYNTEGLLLLTNDGDLAHQLAHPRHQVDKTYLVRVRGHLTAGIIRRLENGIRLEDGLTAPARVRPRRASGGHQWFEITIHEGRNRQIRRMCEAVNLPVSRLKRIRFAFLSLGDLPAGQWRRLSQEEVEKLKKL